MFGLSLKATNKLHSSLSHFHFPDFQIKEENHLSLYMILIGKETRFAVVRLQIAGTQLYIVKLVAYTSTIIGGGGGEPFLTLSVTETYEPLLMQHYAKSSSLQFWGGEGIVSSPL